MIFNESDWLEIKQSEYRYLKEIDPKNFHGYTCRIRFRYFMLKNTYSNKTYSDLSKIDYDIKKLKEEMNKVENEVLEIHRKIARMC